MIPLPKFFLLVLLVLFSVFLIVFSSGEKLGVMMCIHGLSSEDYERADHSLDALVSYGPVAIPQIQRKMVELRPRATMRLIEALVRMGPSGVAGLYEVYETSCDDAMRVTIGLELAKATRDKEVILGLADFLASGNRLARDKIAFEIGLLMERWTPPNISVSDGVVLEQEFRGWWGKNCDSVHWSDTKGCFVWRKVTNAEPGPSPSSP